MDENLTSVQRIETAITPGNNGVRLLITHGLNDRDGNHFTPDEVIVEIVSYPALEGGENPCNIEGHTRIPSSPEDGTFELEIRSSEANGGITDWDITVQTTCLYHHSIQSDDHLPELTVQAGDKIFDCSFPKVFFAGCVAQFDGDAWTDIFVQPLPAPYDTPGDEDDFESTGVHAYGLRDVWTCGHWNWESGFVARWNNGVWTIWDINDGITDALDKIFVISPTDVWAVGWRGACIIMHWDGVSWTDYTATIMPGDDYYEYYGVCALAPDDVWFTGAKYPLKGVQSAVVSHWNGVTFDVLNEVIDDGLTNAQGNDIFIADSNNIWVVGATQDLTPRAGRIWHYNGSVWTDVTPVWMNDPMRCGGMQGVHGLDANHVWAVGGITAKGIGFYTIAYWNGSTWIQITDAVFEEGTEFLWGVFAYSVDDVWITQQDSSYLIYHWDGSTWTNVAHGLAPVWTGFYVASGIWPRLA